MMKMSGHSLLYQYQYIMVANPNRTIRNISIHMSHRSLENKWSEACRAVDKNLPTGIHNIRYTFATRMYNELRAEGMSEKRAEKAVSESLFHHREEITRHYLK